MAVKGYLIDANHIGAWEMKQPTFMARLNQKPPECLIFISVVTLGEVEWGLLTTTTTNAARRKEWRKFVDRELRHYHLDLTLSMSATYADILNRLWLANPPVRGVETDAHLLSMGVDVNDVWLVAVALERGLTVLTEDKMTAIRAVVPEVAFDCWK